MEKARRVNVVNDFGRIADLRLNMKKTQAIWLGKWANNKTNPLDMKWMHTPAIPDRLRLKARQIESVNNQFFTSNEHLFHFNRNFSFNLDKAKSRDLYNLFIDKTHNGGQTGPKRWRERLSLNDEHWANIFKTTRKLCKETKLKEFQFKFIHRIVVTKRELF